MRRASWSAVVLRLSLGAAWAAMGVACSGQRDEATGNSAVEVPVSAIDTDATLSVDPGRGVGVFVEYASGGTWRVYVSCDTFESEVPCHWDVLVSSTGPLTNAEALELSAAAASSGLDIAASGRSAIHLTTETTTELEGMTFESAPGATLRLDVLLDGVADGRFIYWVGGGAVHTGAPASILDLVPTSP